MNAEVEYPIGRFMKVRRLAGTYQIIDSWVTGGLKHKKRRYKLNRVQGTGAMLEVTEAFGEDMDPIPVPTPPEELTLESDPETDEAAPAIRPATQPQERASPAGHAEPAPEAERAAADAIRSPGKPAPDGILMDAGAFGGELDEYSIGARFENPGELQNPFKPIRMFPQSPKYQDLRGIVYNARFKGLENHTTTRLSLMSDGTPIGVIVTHETNGHAIWVVTTEKFSEETRRCNLEQFYPKAVGSEADAIEYAVLLALRQVPIRTEELERLFLEL